MRGKIVAVLAAAGAALLLAVGPANASGIPATSHIVHKAPRTITFHWQLPLPHAKQSSDDALRAGVRPAIAHCEATAQIASEEFEGGDIVAVGHFDCGGFVPYYMAIQVALLTDDDEIEPNNGREAFGVDHLDLVSDPLSIICGVEYTAAAQGAIKLSPDDKGTIFPAVASDPEVDC